MLASTFSLLPETWRYFFGAMTCILTVVSVTENFFVVRLLAKLSILRNPSNVILLSLAMSGVYAALISVPLNSLQLLHTGFLNNDYIDIARRYSSTTSVGVHILTLGFLSLDRCLHMVKLRRYNMPHVAVCAILSFCWLLPLLIPILRIGMGNADPENKIITVFGTMILLSINVSCLSLLFSLRKILMIPEKEMDADKMYIENEKYAGITVLVVTVSCAALLVPAFVFYAMCSLNSYTEVALAKSYIIGIFGALSCSAVTPFVYIVRTPALRHYTKDIFQRQGAGAYTYVSIEESVKGAIV